MRTREWAPGGQAQGHRKEGWDPLLQVGPDTQEVAELVLQPGSPDVPMGTAPGEDDKSPPVTIQLNSTPPLPSTPAAGGH